ncbi:MAG: phosphatidate cytidylyltransferase [Candidatus Korobacteraceae bacterium]
MKRVLTAVILIPIVVLALFRAPLWLFTLLVLGVALLAAKEYFDIAEATGFRPMRGWGYLFLFLLFVVVGVAMANTSLGGHPVYRPSSGTWTACIVATVLLVLAPYVILTASMRREPLSQSLGDAGISVLMLFYVGLTLVLLLPLRTPEFGSLFLLFTMLLVWCGDIAALYVGRALGKHKLAPRVSPGKSWEGTIASAVFAMLLAVVLFNWINPIATGLVRARFMPEAAVGFDLPGHVRSIPLAIPQFEVAPFWLAILFGLSVNVSAQLGDLVESALKRGAGTKDSGTLLPGHGGVLDRIDALLFALPVGMLFYALGMGRYFELVGVR